MMPAQRVDERAVPHEGVFIDMTTEMHELVDEIHARGHAHEQPSDIWAHEKTQHHSQRNRHQDENNQRIWRGNRDAPILGITEPHFLVSEKLMMIERMPLIDRAQPGRCMMNLCTAHSKIFVNKKVSGSVSHSSQVTLWMCAT